MIYLNHSRIVKYYVFTCNTINYNIITSRRVSG